MASAILLSALLSLSALQFITGSRSSAYESFRNVHGGSDFGEGTLSYDARRNLFHQRKAEVNAHNARNVSWKMAINHFSDQTEAELGYMLGYKREMGSRGAASSSFIEINDHEKELDTSKLASEVDWRSSLLKSSTWVRNQGSCGSCWAVASVGALEMHMEKAHGQATKLSHQQLVDCVQNPRHCGGKGGCDGATAELAFDYTQQNGIASDDAYKSSGGSCNAKHPSSLSVAAFTSLPANKGSHLLNAVATHGPVVVSADGGAWFGYSTGVFSGCQKDTVVNHAVVALGYGHDQASNKKFWLIRNSWGPDWGEKGFIKVERHTGDSDYCGTDSKPLDGVFCEDNAPASTPVCGMCGITSDSAFPTIAPTASQNKGALRATKSFAAAAKQGVL